MYEHLKKPLLSQQAFLKRLVLHGVIGLSIILVSLFIGVVGYHTLAHQPWIDALLNASMILGGMGPVDTLPNNGAKLFASVYALYSGLILLVSVGIFFAPIFHRILHRLHVETIKEGK